MSSYPTRRVYEAYELFHMKYKISRQQIIDYYDSCEIDYRMIWNLDRSYAMHYGYWDEKVKNFPQAPQREKEILA